MSFQSLICLVPIIGLSGAFPISGAMVANESSFESIVRPFLRTYCTDCHGGEKPKAKLDLSVYQNLALVLRDHGHWLHVLDRVHAGDMPPEDAKQPAAKDRKDLVTWIETLRRQEAERNAGDPGIVLARRLSNAEYDYSVRDLTGVDLRPTSEFPIDPANESGFDNSGESLTLSPALLKKYLGAARHIANHLVMKPDGIEFAPYPVVTDTDRDKFCVNRIIAFYNRQETNLTEYFLAAWETKHGRPVSNPRVSRRYLNTVMELLEGTEHDLGPIATVRREWRRLPGPERASADEVRRACDALRQKVEVMRAPLSPQFEHLDFGKIIHRGAPAFVYWYNRQYAGTRRNLDPDAVDLSAVAPDNRPAFVAAYKKFCSVFPNLLVKSERGREYLKPDQKRNAMEMGRLLSAGLHSQSGYFRDDQPLCELILTEAQRRELDGLWLDLDVVAQAPVRQHKGMVWFERTDSQYLRSEEFDFARAEDQDVVSEEKIKRLGRVYLAKAMREGADEKIAEAIRQHFRIIEENIRRMERAAAAAEPIHLREILDFATRAYRRPLSNSERDKLLKFYHRLRTNEEASHEDAMRDLVVSILMSPHFWYRVDLPAGESGIHPLSDYALASRLSYFLWSSLPDDELLAAANRGELREEDELVRQSLRMLRDKKIRALALEFGGNWLDFRQFEKHNSVDRQRFPDFTDDLRRAMFEEPIRFLEDVVREDRSILDFLFGDHTWVNPVLARHYGLADVDGWKRVDVRRNQRGGLLPMAVFQTHNAGGLRTSPVKRGYWVVRRLLGEHIPPPPPSVPELPNDEGVGRLSLRQQLAAHRENPDCAACHDRFDGIGLAFEGYGPIGEWRTRDLGDRPVDARGVFPGGTEGVGLSGLQKYLREHRQEEFVESLCRKLFAYALGRNLMLSDDPTIAMMTTELKKNEYRFGTLIESIVTSRQFRFQRGRFDMTQRQP